MGSTFTDDDDKCITDLVQSIDTFLQNIESREQEHISNNYEIMEDENSDDVQIIYNHKEYDYLQESENQDSLKTVGEGQMNDNLLAYHFQMAATQRLVVRHDYHDFNLPGSVEKLLSPNEKRKLEKRKKKMQLPLQLAQNSTKNMTGKLKRMPFPLALHKLLEDSIKDDFCDIIAWQDHGRSFKVLDTKRFVDHILPRYFNQTRYQSFLRQLSLYGFLRLTRIGKDSGSYYHERFLRGNPLLASVIQRKAVKGTGVPYIPSPETEPDFDLMPTVF